MLITKSSPIFRVVDSDGSSDYNTYEEAEQDVEAHADFEFPEERECTLEVWEWQEIEDGWGEYYLESEEDFNKVGEMTYDREPEINPDR